MNSNQTVQAVQTTQLVITGLPGCGKTRVIQSLPSDYLNHSSDDETPLSINRPIKIVEVLEVNGLEALLNAERIWCVIDVRSIFLAGRDDWLEARLKNLVKQANGIVFSFLESSSLDEQAWWSRWVNQHAKGLPIVRWLNQRFPSGFSDQWAGFKMNPKAELTLLKKGCSGVERFSATALPNLQSFHFSVKRISLEHLLFGLDSSKQNLGMKIVRVQGVVQTIEYANLVAIEGSALRWDTFAATSDTEAGSLTIQGIGLEKSWLEELVNASLA